MSVVPQVELNKTYDWGRITEAGSKLVPLRGPGYVGLKNLGNSCYMVSPQGRSIWLWSALNGSRPNAFVPETRV
jgi:uncharacterized UBP type Zn finger protein